MDAVPDTAFFSLSVSVLAIVIYVMGEKLLDRMKRTTQNMHLSPSLKLAIPLLTQYLFLSQSLRVQIAIRHRRVSSRS